MTRFLAVCLACLAVAFLAACGGGGGGAAPMAASDPEPIAQPEPEPAPSQSDMYKATLNRLIANADSVIVRPRNDFLPAQNENVLRFGESPSVPGNRFLPTRNVLKAGESLSFLFDTDLVNISNDNDIYLDDFSGLDWDLDYELLTSHRDIEIWRGEHIDEYSTSRSDIRRTVWAYTALLEHSFFAVGLHHEHLHPLVGAEQGATIRAPGVNTYSVGAASKSNPTFEGTWEGAMIGALSTYTLCGGTDVLPNKPVLWGLEIS